MTNTLAITVTPPLTRERILSQHLALCAATLRHTALQHTATHCNTLQLLICDRLDLCKDLFSSCHGLFDKMLEDGIRTD